MTSAQMQALAHQLVDDIRGHVARAISRAVAPRDERIALLATQRESADQLLADLEERVSKLERERLRAS